MLQKGYRKIDEKIEDVMKLVEDLALAGDMTSDKNTILYTLAGLREEYKSFVQNFMTRGDEISFVHLQAVQSDIEARQE